MLFFFNATATTEIYTLSLHDALPISTADAGSRPRSPVNHLPALGPVCRSEEHTSELQSHSDLVCRLLLEKKNELERQALDRLRGVGRDPAPDLGRAGEGALGDVGDLE